MSDPQVAELLQQGIAAVKEGRNEEARRLLLQVVNLDEESEQGWLWLSGVLETPEDQRVCLENVLALNPNNSHARAGLEWLAQQAPTTPLVEEEDLASAGQDRCPRCEEPVSASQSECPHCGLPLIVTCPACGQYTEVHLTTCSSCGQTLGDFHDGTHYYLSLAQAYLEGRKLDRAAEIIDRALQEAPSDPQVFETAAVLYEKTGQTDKAIAVCEQAIELAPKNPALYTRLGGLYRQQLRPAEARAMYEQAAKLAGSEPNILIELAELHLEEGQFEKGRGLLIQVLRKMPENARAHLLMGNALASQNHLDQALRHYGQAVQMSEPNSSIGLHAEQQLVKLQNSMRQQTEGQPPRTARAKARGRPGCLTIYAILLATGGFFGTLSTLLAGALLLLSGGMIEGLGPLPGEVEALPFALSLPMIMWGAIGVTLLMSLLNLVIAVGLWRLKNWARMAVIILQSFSFLAGLAQAAVTVSTVSQELAAYGAQTPSLILLGSLLVGFLIQAYIIFWFVANGELFD